MKLGQTKAAARHARKVQEMRDSAGRASRLLKAMSNQHRLLILCQLGRGEMSVGALEKIVGLSQSALSQHLARLRRDALVKTRRSAQTIYYSLAGEEATAVINTLRELFRGTNKSAAFEADYITEKIAAQI